jgi:hypothetical protein
MSYRDNRLVGMDKHPHFARVGFSQNEEIKTTDLPPHREPTRE